MKKRLLYQATKELLAGYVFDGTVIYMPNRIQPDPLELFVENENGEKIRITIRLVAEVRKEDSKRLQIYNIIMRKCLRYLNLQLVGRNYFDAGAKVR